MLSGIINKINNTTSSITINANSLIKPKETMTTIQTNVELPLNIKLASTHDYCSEFGITYSDYIKSKTNPINNLTATNNKIELGYNKIYSLNSDFTIASGNILVLKRTILVLNGYTLHIRGQVEMSGPCTICNGFISVETTDINKDVFVVKPLFVRENQMIPDSGFINFNGIYVECVDDGAHDSFVSSLTQNYGSSNSSGPYIMDELINYLYLGSNALLSDYVEILTPNDVKKIIFTTWLSSSQPDPISAFYNEIDILSKNDSKLKDIFSDLFFTKQNDGSLTKNDKVKKIFEYIQSKPETFISIQELLKKYDGKLARFTNFIKLLVNSTINIRYFTYYDKLEYNIRTANGLHLYGYHDFITDRYVDTTNSIKKCYINVEYSNFIMPGYASENGIVIFNLNSELKVSNSHFDLSGVYELCCNNFIEESKVKKYSDKIFENCDIILKGSNKLLEVDGGDVIFKKCKIKLFDTHSLITFRRYPQTNTKKIRVCFENCDIIGDNIAGENDLYNEHYCKIIINKIGNSNNYAELYVNNDEMINASNFINERSFSDVDEFLKYNDNKDQEICYLKAELSNRFEGSILITSE